MMPYNVGLYAALCCIAPVILWLVLQLYVALQGNHQIAHVIHLGFISLIFLQSLVAIAYMPWQIRTGQRSEQVQGLIVFLLVPVPVLSVFWLTGVEGVRVIGIGFSIVFLSLMISFLVFTLFLKLEKFQSRFPIGIVFLQVIMTTLFLISSTGLLELIGA